MATLRFTIEGDTYDLDMERILNVEAIAAQKVTGKKWDEILDDADKSDAEAITAVVWIALKRKNPDLRFTDVSFPFHEVWTNREFVGDDADPPKQDGEGSAQA